MRDQNEHGLVSSMPPAMAECGTDAAERGSPSNSGPFNDLRFVDHMYQRHGRANDTIWSF